MRIRPFANAVRAGTGAIMAGYNQINNSYAGSNSYALNHLLKGELGYQGFVMTDWGGHHGGVSSALAGLDMSMPGDTPILGGTSLWGANLTTMVLNGTVPEWRLDDACMRIIASMYKVGRMENRNAPNVDVWTTSEYAPIPLLGSRTLEKVNDRVSVRDSKTKILNREIATGGIVMLKNTNATLPLSGQEYRIGIFGEDAGANDYGVNGCRDKACSRGTLTSQWGSGSWLMPYVITPENALTSYIVEETNGSVASITNNYADDQIEALASQVSAALVFVSATSGEGYITFDGNYGDRNNLSLWNDGAPLIDKVTKVCPNTIVVMHTVGPVNMSSFYDNPNVTAILWSAPPGEQSGNAIKDVIYGKHNPSGKLPFTMARRRSDYVADVLYEPNRGHDPPQQDLAADIDYRHFDRHNITPLYEFGFGLSYTTFNYSDLVVTALDAPPYLPINATSLPASVISSNPINVSNANVSEYLFPDDIPQYPTVVYPYLSSTNLSQASRDRNYGRPSRDWLPENATSSAAQPVHSAGGAPGGNPMLWVPLYNVSLAITNTGSVAGHEVVQLYLGLGKESPPRVLRGFERLYLEAGETKSVTMQLLRRDMSVWDTVKQNWVAAGEHNVVEVWVGASSRDLRLNGKITMDEW